MSMFAFTAVAADLAPAIAMLATLTLTTLTLAWWHVVVAQAARVRWRLARGMTAVRLW